MQSILLRKNQAALEALSFTETLFAFDFDGTLSRIVKVPGDAAVARKTEDLLKTLARHATVAVISGRSVPDLRSRVKFEPQVLIGNHGIEGADADLVALGRARESTRRWVRALGRVSLGAGVEIEDKAYSLAIHYRRSRSKKAARERILEAIAQLRPQARVIHGKSVFNLLPREAPHKGLALLHLMERLQLPHALYIGDDDTDEDVFGLPDADGRITTVRVGRKRDSRAQYFIERQEDINRLLELLVGFYAK